MNVLEPEGTLAPAQHEIMHAVWESGEAGATVAEIWQRIARTRPVTRTTILNQVDRLEKRRWLSRRQEEGVYRYVAVLDRQTARERLAGEFVGEFFGGSAGNLVAALLGSRNLKPGEVRRLREILDRGAPERIRKGGDDERVS